MGSSMAYRCGGIALALALLAPLTTLAGPQVEAGVNPPSRLELDLGGDFISVGHFRTDNDFDATPRYYDPDGQTEGQVATWFAPALTLELPEDRVRIYYALELGWAAWSASDPGVATGTTEEGRSGITLRHKQLWAEWSDGDGLRLRAGYLHFEDKSRLLLDHEGGAARIDLEADGLEAALWVGQLPDDTYEGVDIREDNFVNDSVLVAVDGSIELVEHLWLDVGAYALNDRRVDRRPLNLITALAGLRAGEVTDGGQLRLHLLGQAGSWARSGVAGVDQGVIAWAGSVDFTHRVDELAYRMGAFALSGDDEHHGNGHLGAFFGSGKNHSPSRYLTEDELRDRYDNLDERVASSWGSFVYNRAGLAVVDLAISYALLDWYAPEAIAAIGLPMEAKNAGGADIYGVELTWINGFPLNRRARIDLIGGTFIPGKAAAVFVNDVDREAVELVFFTQLGLTVRL